ncbi:hypothetical protein MLD52_13585 [Puniceicoccaceae bacterium K14]|nr:hypothetical protein [Puniceicoccaceae bacterium K14]
MSFLSDHVKAYLHNRPRKVIVFAAVFAFLCVLAQPLYQGFKVWRSNSLRKESQKLWEAESYELSFNKAYTAYLLNPHDIDSLRNLADTALKLGIPKANEFWEGVINSKEVMPSDWESAVDASLRVGEVAKAFDYLIRWQRSDEVGESYNIRKARAYIAASEYTKAKRVISELVDAGINNKDVFWLHARYVQLLGSKEERQNLRGVAVELSKKKDDLGLIASRYILDSLDFELIDRIEAADRFFNHPDRSEVDALRALSILIQNDRYDRKEILSRIESDLDLKDQGLLAALTTLLCEIEEYQYVLDLVDEFSSQQSPEVYRNYLIAELNKGEMDRVLDLTSQNDRRIASMAVESVLRAQIFHDSGIDANYEQNLEESVKQAGQDDIVFLESQFRKLGEERVLLQLYLKAGEESTYGHHAKRLYLDLAMRLKDELALQRGIDDIDLALILRKNPFEQARWVYLCFLYGINEVDARKVAQELAARYPTDLYFRLILSMAHWKSGNIDKAAFLANAPIERLMQLNPRSRLIVAMVLKEANEPVPVGLVSSLDEAKLLPKEIELLRTI